MALTKVDISLVDNSTGFTIVTKVVTVAASKYVIDGVSQDTLTLTEGYTYKFDTSHATNATHHFKFSTTADGTHGSGVDYTTGVTYNGTPGSAGAYTQIVVAASAPTLYYWCHHHASMGGITSTPTAVIANKLLAYDGSGNLPAVDGSQMINVATGSLSSASDPTVSTNPSGGVGTQWNNTTSGEVYICTDATAGENVWTNIGAGSGGIKPWHYPGETYGYVMGGHPTVNTIQRFAFASATTNAEDSNRDLTVARSQSSATRSATHGYMMGGEGGTVIDKFAFATASANSTDVGDMTYTSWGQGAAGSSATAGYVLAMYSVASGYPGTINKFSFETDGNATDVADLATDTYGGAGTNNQTHIFQLGGRNMGVGGINNIQKFSMSSEANATNVATLAVAVQHTQGTSSATKGYCSGGSTNGPETAYVDHIQEFNFSTEANATDVGNLTLARTESSPQSSETYSYTSGGKTTYDRIDRFAYSNPGYNSTDVGNLIAGAKMTAGTQY